MRFRFTASIAAVLLTVGVSGAQTTLKYKFEAGQKLPYTIKQIMSMTINVNGQATQVKMDQTMDVVWDISKVLPDGSATLVQRITRGQVKMDSPQGKVDLDTQGGKEPTDGIGKQLATLYKAMVGADISMKISPRGVISDVVIPPEVLKAFKNDPSLAQLGNMFTEQGVKQMMAQSTVVFPDKPLKENDTWKGETIEMKNSGVDAKMDIADTFEKVEKIDGKDIARISRKMTMEMKPNQPVAMKIKGQDTKATVLFDVAAGKVTSSDMKQKMVMDVSQGEIAINMLIEQSVQMTLGK